MRADPKRGPVFDESRCVKCGECIAACPTDALFPFRDGFRIQVGGKLGRHPQLGSELPGIHSADTVVRVMERSARLILEQGRRGERFGDLLNRLGLEQTASRLLQG